jgi:hypothetical protein
MGYINGFIAAIGTAIGAVLSLLPNSPFSWSLGGIGTYWGYVTVFIPIPEMITEMGLYLSAVLAYYSIRVILRFADLIE